MAELIKKTDTLNQGREKLNEAIKDAEVAKGKSESADVKATQALAKSESTQTQLDTIVINGDSSVEAAQARVDTEGTAHATLKERLDSEHSEVSAHLAQTEQVTEKIKYDYRSQIKLRPLFTFVDDDGSTKVGTVLKDAFRTRNLPCTLAIVSDFLIEGKGISKDNLLNFHQNAWGWEIASHTKSHARLTDLSPQEIEAELRISKETLSNYGFDVKSVVYPYGASNKDVRAVAAKYYDAAVATRHGMNKPPLQQYSINRISISRADGGKLVDYKYYVDDAIAKNNWLIFMTHVGTMSEGDIQDLNDLLDYIISKNGEVVNLRDGLEVFGNTIYKGDFNGDSSKDVFNILTKTGIEVSNNLDKTTVKASTLINEFPYGFTKTQIKYGEGAGLPGVDAGNLITFRDMDDDRFSYQILREYGVDRMQIRPVLQDGTWGEFTIINERVRNKIESTVNKYKASDKPSKYPKGEVLISHYNSGGQTGFPIYAGIVTTYRPNDNDLGYARQEVRGYQSNSVWSRYGKTDDTWTDFVKISAV